MIVVVVEGFAEVSKSRQKGVEFLKGFWTDDIGEGPNEYELLFRTPILKGKI